VLARNPVLFPGRGVDAENQAIVAADGIQIGDQWFDDIVARGLVDSAVRGGRVQPGRISVFREIFTSRPQRQAPIVELKILIGGTRKIGLFAAVAEISC
jgi:hypothetical protein